MNMNTGSSAAGWTVDGCRIAPCPNKDGFIYEGGRNENMGMDQHRATVKKNEIEARKGEISESLHEDTGPEG
jgi:hypothetical protein